VARHRLLPPLRGGPAFVAQSLAFSPDGRTLAAGSDGRHHDGHVIVEADGLEFRFGYFPSLDRLRALAAQVEKIKEAHQADLADNAGNAI